MGPDHEVGVDPSLLISGSLKVDPKTQTNAHKREVTIWPEMFPFRSCFPGFNLNITLHSLYCKYFLAEVILLYRTLSWPQPLSCTSYCLTTLHEKFGSKLTLRHIIFQNLKCNNFRLTGNADKCRIKELHPPFAAAQNQHKPSRRGPEHIEGCRWLNKNEFLQHGGFYEFAILCGILLLF